MTMRYEELKKELSKLVKLHAMDLETVADIIRVYDLIIYDKLDYHDEIVAGYEISCELNYHEEWGTSREYTMVKI